MAAKKTTKKVKPSLPIFKLAFLAAGLLLIFFVWWLQKPPARLDLDIPGQLIEGRAEPADAYKSLDLRVAAKATYASAKLQVADNLGVTDGVNHQIVRFKVAKDGLNEFALMTLPNGPAPEEGFPVVILCHGYYNPLYYPTERAYLEDMEAYSQAGYAVIKPDFRGQGKSVADGKPEGAYYSMAYNTDVMSLISAIKQTNYLNKDKINIWGHSMGAYIALRAAVLSPDIKATVLLSGPVGNIQDMYTSYVAISDSNNAVAAGVRADQLARHGTPVTNPDFWDNTSPLNFLDHTKAFVQIHVGTADQLVPPRFSADLDTALSRVHKDHEYFVYQDGRHGLLNQRPLILQRSLAVFRQKG